MSVCVCVRVYLCLNSGGDGGGKIVAKGPPEQVMRRKRGSHTAKALAAFIGSRGSGGLVQDVAQ